MTRLDWVSNQWRGFLRGDTVPRAPVLLVSVVAHVIALVVFYLLVVFARAAPVIVFSRKLQIAPRVPAAAVYLPPLSRGARLEVAQKNARRVPRKPREPGTNSTGDSAAVQALRKQAKLETAGLIQHFKFLGTYGFSSNEYQLAVQTSGEIPVISATQVPPHFEQLVIVEVTINTQGQVADARITAGEAGPKIERTLLAAIREFKYRPATREGIPIPSQCDIVIHIPT